MILIIVSAFIMVVGTLLSVAKIPMNLGLDYVLPTLYDAKIAWVMTHSLTSSKLTQFALPSDVPLIGQGVMGAFFVILFGSESPIAHIIINIPTILWIFLYLIGFAHFFRKSALLAALMIAASLTLYISSLLYFLILGILLLSFWRIAPARRIGYLGFVLLLGILINPFLLGLAL